MKQKLDEFQLEAVDIKGNALIIAGPGSGKTKVLTTKIIKELKNLKHRTNKIVALTFTNKAAEEISERLNFMEEETSQFWSGTIHSFCMNWIIKPYGLYYSRLSKGYSIIDEYEVEKIKSNIKKKYNIPLYKDFITKRNIKGEFTNSNDNYNKAAEKYHEYLIEKKLLDFDTILYYSYIIILKFPIIPYNLSRIFSYFFIDEYQDTQEIQYYIIGSIIRASNGNCNYFIVGDVDQAIYNSIGGKFKTIDEIKEIMGGFPVNQLNLMNNYRSTKKLVEFYSKFSNSGNKLEALSRFHNEEGIIKYNKSVNKNELVDSIVEIIETNISNGIPENEICILAPQWRLLTSIVRQIKIKLPDIDFNSPGLTVIPRNSENIWFKIARLILVLKLSNNYLIRIKWAKEIIEELSNILNRNFESENMGYKKLLKITDFKEIENKNIIDYLKGTFVNIMNDLNINYKENQLLSIKWNNFFEAIYKRMNSDEFKNIPADVIYTKKIFNSREGINIDTFHGVKGKEYKTVIAFGLLEGYIPNWNIIINFSKDFQTKEAKQLLYVICSRAKQNLYLFAEKGRNTRRGTPLKPNLLLEEIDFKNI